MALNVLCSIASIIAESEYYSILADESADVSNIEQLVVCICWVDKEMTGCKEYIGQSDASHSDKCRYNCRFHQRRDPVYESQNSRCSWAVL